MSVAEERKAFQVTPDRIGLAENKRQDWVIDVPPFVREEDVLDPAFLANVATHPHGSIRPLDKIEVRYEDGSKIIHLRVLWAQPGYAKVRMISREVLEVVTDEDMESRHYVVKWRGPTHRFAIIRKSDSEVLEQDFHDKGEAVARMEELSRE